MDNRRDRRTQDQEDEKLKTCIKNHELKFASYRDTERLSRKLREGQLNDQINNLEAQLISRDRKIGQTQAENERLRPKAE